MRWAETNGRDFAWRHTKDPYYVLMAEMMVHRTRARQAEAVWTRFTSAFPTPATAAMASDERLDPMLAPLGLSWRLSLFKQTLRRLPSLESWSPDALRELPGVGHYAAHSVAAVCNDSDDPVVDSNVVRIYSRILGIRPSDSLRRDARFHDLARQLLPAAGRARYNWALLDLGAELCRPRRPRCAECPLARRCVTATGG